MTVLVLNQDYAPLAVAREPRALALIGRGKAELLERGVLPIQTSSCMIDRPSVIRLISFVKRPRPHVRFSRQNVFKRDGFVCQYCGARPQRLTIDHVIPVSRGGKDVWTNVAAACLRCNHKKGAKTPDEARMVLARKPIEPVMAAHMHLIGVEARSEWLPYLPV